MALNKSTIESRFERLCVMIILPIQSVLEELGRFP